MSDAAFPELHFPLDPAHNRAEKLGIVVGGSLAGGLEVKLDRDTIIEGLAVGSYVTITGQTTRKFIGLITDIALDAVDDTVRKSPPNLDNALLAKIYRGGAVYGTLRVQPHLVLETGNAEPRPVKTVPAHFALVCRATPAEVQAIFASQQGEDTAHPYTIGSSLEDEKLKININLDRLTERSTAVFGRSGTGKTFLTLPLLASVIQQKVASALIFDMHNDYGTTLKGDKNKKLPGLKKLASISNRVIVVTLDEQSALARKSQPEFALKISFDKIEPEDLESLKAVLSLSDVQANALYLLKNKFKADWLQKLMADEADDDIRALFDGNKVTESTYFAIQRKLGRLLHKLEFLTENPAQNFVERIIGYLTRGDSVVIEFGRYGNDLPAYVFVANYITRRIHARYVEMKESAEGGGGAEPHKLVIVIEEAHKFLEPAVAEHTIFGTIARELRKYNVTLLIVDQRPSQIDSEVMSQIGTRITCALSDEKDIAAVFTGISGAQTLKHVLASLDSKQQALLMGHAVPMPVVVRTASYDEAKQSEYDLPISANTSSSVSNNRKLGRSDDDDSLI